MKILHSSGPDLSQQFSLVLSAAGREKVGFVYKKVVHRLCVLVSMLDTIYIVLISGFTMSSIEGLQQHVLQP